VRVCWLGRSCVRLVRAPLFHSCNPPSALGLGGALGAVAKFNWERFPVSRGTREDAENYVKANLVVKPNFYSVVAFWTWCNLLGDWHDERLKQDDPNDVTSLVYNTADLSVPVIKASMPQLTQPIIKPMTSRMERQE